MIPLLRLLQMRGGREEGLEQNARRPTRSEAGVWGRCAQMPSLPSWEAARPLASPQGSGSVFRALGTAAGWEGPTLLPANSRDLWYPKATESKASPVSAGALGVFLSGRQPTQAGEGPRKAPGSRPQLLWAGHRAWH